MNFSDIPIKNSWLWFSQCSEVIFLNTHDDQHHLKYLFSFRGDPEGSTTPPTYYSTERSTSPEGATTDPNSNLGESSQISGIKIFCMICELSRVEFTFASQYCSIGFYNMISWSPWVLLRKSDIFQLRMVNWRFSKPFFVSQES